RVAQEAADTHRERTSELKPVYEAWNTFRERHGDDTRAGAIADSLSAAVGYAEVALRTTNELRHTANSHTPGLKATVDRANQMVRQTAERIAKLGELKPMALAFAKLFHDEAPEGLVETVRAALSAATKRQTGLLQRQRALD